MGLADLILGKTNPFAAFVDQNHNSIRGAGAQFAQGTSLGGALSGAAQGYAQGAPADDAYATQQKAEQQRLDDIAKTSAWLKQNYPQYASLPPEQGFEIASKLAAQKAGGPPADPASVAEYKFYANQEIAAGRTPQPYDAWRQGSNQTQRAGVGQPITYRNKKNPAQLIYMQPMTSGPAVVTMTGKPLDNPDDWEPAPFEVASQKAAGTAYGTIGGTAAGGLSGAALKAEQALGVINNLRGLNEDGTPNDRYAQGRKDTFGTYGLGPIQIPDQWGITMPQSAKADYAALISQAGGQQFLTAYQGLKGTGAISEAEGAQAKDAVARMSQAQSDKAFQDALNDYEAIIRKGYEVEKSKAQTVGYGGDAPGLSDPLGIR